MLIKASDLKLKFEGREKEITECISVLAGEQVEKHLVHVLFGESGIGKTRFVQEIAANINGSDPEHLFTYLDVTDDTRTKGKLFSNLLLSLWLDSSNPEKGKRGFSSFLGKRKISERAKKALYKGIYNSLKILPSFGSFAESLFEKDFQYDEKLKPVDVDEVQLLKEYFKFSLKNGKHTLQLDNFQRATEFEKREVANLLSALPINFSLLLIFRVDSSVMLNKSAYQNFENFDLAIQYLDSIDSGSVEKIFRTAFPEMSEYQRSQLILECKSKTSGNTRDIEQFIVNYKLNSRLDTSTAVGQVSNPILQTIEQLGELERSLIIITSLFPEGVDFDYIRLFFQSKTNQENVELPSILVFLVECRLLSIVPEEVLKEVGFSNGQIELIKASHDKVIAAAKIAMSDEEVASVRERLANVLSGYANIVDDDEKQMEAMLAFAQLATSRELAQNIDSFERSLFILRDRNRYLELCLLAENSLETIENANETLSLFSLESSIIMLDSCIKESKFEVANRLLEALGKVRSPEIFDIYTAKIAAQTYDYEKALLLLNNHLNSSEALSIYLNILQHKRRDKDAKITIQDRLMKVTISPRNDYEAIILRNSAHLFDYQSASSNLGAALKWFENKGDVFSVATVLNNIGLNELYNPEPDLKRARLVLEEARSTLLSINSVEAYQATFNLGLCEALECHYESALKLFITAYNMVPEPLNYDRAKFLATISIVRVLHEPCEFQRSLSKLKALIDESRAISDPWLLFMLRVNHANLKAAFCEDESGKGLFELELNQERERYQGDPDIYAVLHRHSDGLVQTQSDTSP